MREKRLRGQDKTEPLFEYILDSLDPNEPFTLDFSGVPASAICECAGAAKQQAARLARTAKLISASSDEKPEQDGLQPEEDDPLHPDNFIGHHRRMERDERRMQLLERQQLIAAAAKVRSQKDQLLRPDWKSQIEKIVRINDINDAYETKRKRELAIQEMTVFLEKYDENNKRACRRDSKPAQPKKKKPPPKKAAPPKSARAPQPPPPKPKPALSAYADFVGPETPTISIRPYAFGHMLPARQFPPVEFRPPSLMMTEIQSYDLIEKYKQERLRMGLDM